MIIRIDKLFEEFASQRLLDTDYPKHVLPNSDDIVGDFVNQEYDIGASSRPKYPMFPYMTKQDYEKAADNLRLSNADGFIGYNLRVNKKDGSSNYEPRAVKYRKMDLPATKHDREFYEMVIYSVRDDKVIAYYLCTKWRINKEKKTAVFDFDGNPIGDDSLRQQLFADKQSMEMVSNYLQRLYHEKPDDNIDESYSQQKTLTNRFGSVIGFIKIDPTNGNQMLLNRFGSVRGYYQARTDITTNRLGGFVGNGNLLMTLLSEDNLKESAQNFSQKFEHVEWYEKDGWCPVKDFLQELPTPLSDKVLLDMYKLDMLGSEARPPLTKKISDDIFELRTKRGTDAVRNFFFFYHNGKIIITNGYVKKTQKMSDNEFERAKRYRADYLLQTGGDKS